ncbi:MAG: outer membrane protein assembly factor BamA [Thermodesulfobacteriota bacterium]|nr:MAG: outer membrane protein assembly factor BamA [Thermodesulfobacteriota bacterium]
MPMEKLLMQINKRTIKTAVSLIALVLLITMSLYPALVQATGVEKITIKDALKWEVAQGTPTNDSQDTEIEEEGDLSSTNDTILQVKIEGNRRIETELIELNITSKTGNNLSTATVREDVKKIYALGSFEDVTAEIDRTENGIILIYKVKEKPIIADLRITGNKDIKSDDILEVITVREGSIIDLNTVKKSQETIGELYSEQGVVGTVVDYEIEPEGDGTVSVTFEIREGKKAFIKEVNFIGNEKLKTKVVKKGIYSKTKGIFSFISKKGLYNAREVDNDSERIRTTYIDNGFLDAKVAKPEVEFSEEKDGFIVTFKISEGDQFTVNELSFQGDLIVPVEELQELLALKSGEIFRGSLLARDITGLTTFYGNQGFAFANAEPNFALDRQALTVDIRFNMEKGPEVYIRDINIVGNHRTRDKVIRREIPIQEQQLYNASEVQAIRPRVRRLGFFEENVEVVSQRVPGQEDKLDLEVRVDEKSTGFFSVAGGFSSIETFIFAGQIQESNLFGYGKTVSLNAQVGGVTQLFFLNYADPNLFDTDWNLDALIFRTSRAFRDFDRSSIGASVTVGRRIWRWLDANITYRIENVKISDIDDNARLILTSENRTISSLGFGLKWDSRNNLLDPSKGNLTRTNLQFAGGPFGGNTDFIKYILSSRQWFSLPFNTVFTVRARYGIIDFRNTGNDLVVGERFFLGGPNSLRGYGFRRVGPRVPTEDGNFVIIGGVQELLFSADYVFPLIPSAGLRGVVFFDMGNAFNDGEDLTINPSDLRTDVGLGFRWVSPLGPLRLEVGIPLGDRLPGENSYEIQFTVGTLF